jgi:hypothetical protein
MWYFLYILFILFGLCTILMNYRDCPIHSNVLHYHYLSQFSAAVTSICENQFKREKIYFASWFHRFQSMMAGPIIPGLQRGIHHCVESMIEQNCLPHGWQEAEREKGTGSVTRDTMTHCQRHIFFKHFSSSTIFWSFIQLQIYQGSRTLMMKPSGDYTFIKWDFWEDIHIKPLSQCL